MSIFFKSHAFFAVSIALAAFAFGGCDEDKPKNKVVKPPAEDDPFPANSAFAPVGGTVPVRGYFDPTMTSADGKRLWMSYSAVEPSPTYPTEQNVTNTALAYSDDKGRTWNYATTLNTSTDVNDLAVNAQPADHGSWKHETSSIVYDPADKLWKMVWIQELFILDQVMFEHAWMAAKTATTPEGLATAPATKFIAPIAYHASNNTQGGSAKPPISGAPVIAISSKPAPLATCAIIHEPTLLPTATHLYLAFTCIQASPLDFNVVLMKCANPCGFNNASAWTYAGTILTKADGLSFAVTEGFTASHLFGDASRQFIVSTPKNADSNGGFRGCKVFEFDNIATATLKKELGRAKVLQSHDAASGVFDGACTYHLNADSGLVHSELEVQAGSEPIFQRLKFKVISTGKKIPN